MVCTEQAKPPFLGMMKIVMRHFAAEANQSHNKPAALLQLLRVRWVCPSLAGFFSPVSICKTGWLDAGVGSTFSGQEDAELMDLEKDQMEDPHALSSLAHHSKVTPL